VASAAKGRIGATSEREGRLHGKEEEEDEEDEDDIGSGTCDSGKIRFTRFQVGVTQELQVQSKEQLKLEANPAGWQQDETKPGGRVGPMTKVKSVTGDLWETVVGDSSPMKER